MKIILGSASWGRKKVLKDLGFDCVVMPPNIDEKAIRDNDPEKLVLKIANAKADALLKKINEDVILITGDQVVYFDGKILEKPKDQKQAYEFLKSYGTKNPVEFIGSLVLVNTMTGKRVESLQYTKVYLDKISDTVIDAHIKKGGALDAAGGIKIESKEIGPFVKKLEGGLDSAMGLSETVFKELLEQVK